MGNPSPIMACQDLSQLVCSYTFQSCLSLVSSASNRNLCGHTSHCKSSPLMTYVDECGHIGLHKRRCHGEILPIGGNIMRRSFKPLDVAESIIPSATVQA